MSGSAMPKVTFSVPALERVLFGTTKVDELNCCEFEILLLSKASGFLAIPSKVLSLMDEHTAGCKNHKSGKPGLNLLEHDVRRLTTKIARKHGAS